MGALKIVWNPRKSDGANASLNKIRKDSFSRSEANPCTQNPGLLEEYKVTVTVLWPNRLKRMIVIGATFIFKTFAIWARNLYFSLVSKTLIYIHCLSFVTRNVISHYSAKWCFSRNRLKKDYLLHPPPSPHCHISLRWGLCIRWRHECMFRKQC